LKKNIKSQKLKKKKKNKSSATELGKPCQSGYPNFSGLECWSVCRGRPRRLALNLF